MMITEKCVDTTRQGLIHYALFTAGLYTKVGSIKMTPESTDAALLIKDLADDYRQAGYISPERAQDFADKAEQLAQAIEAKNIKKAKELATVVELDAQDLIASAIVQCECKRGK